MCYTRRIIGFGGPSGSGKSLAATLLPEGKCIAYADFIKQAMQKALGFTDEQLWGKEKDVVDPRWGTTPRKELQDFGTYMRDRHGPDVWVKRACVAMEELWDAEVIYVTDVRYKEEADSLHRMGGEIWDIHRPGAGLVGEAAQHSSEAGLPAECIDVTIVNDSTIEEFKKKLEVAFKL